MGAGTPELIGLLPRKPRPLISGARPMDPSTSAEQRRDAPGWFTTTHWTVVLTAKAEDTTLAAEAVGQLCQWYWAPIRAYIRSRGYSDADAQDLTQQFFARFLEKQHYRRADRERGRFRSFLLTAVKHMLINEWERRSAQKRGGGRVPVSLDEPAPGEDQPPFELEDGRTAERIYEQRWALTLLARVRERLAAEYREHGGTERFAILERFLPG